METYPPTHSSIALQKNNLNVCFDDVFPFFVFLRTPSHYDYSFEVKQTDSISKAIEFISPKIDVKSENITLLNIKTKEQINNSSTFGDFQIGDIILVSHDGLIPDDDIPELPPELGENVSQSPSQELPPPAETQLSQENRTPERNPSFDDLFSTQDEPTDQTINNLNDLTLSDIRRLLTPKQKNFINNLISTYSLDEPTVSQIFLICEKNEAKTEEMIAQMVS